MLLEKYQQGAGDEDSEELKTKGRVDVNCWGLRMTGGWGGSITACLVLLTDAAIGGCIKQIHYVGVKVFVSWKRNQSPTNFEDTKCIDHKHFYFQHQIYLFSLAAVAKKEAAFSLLAVNLP